MLLQRSQAARLLGLHIEELLPLIAQRSSRDASPSDSSSVLFVAAAAEPKVRFPRLLASTCTGPSNSNSLMNLGSGPNLSSSIWQCSPKERVG